MGLYCSSFYCIFWRFFSTVRSICWNFRVLNYTKKVYVQLNCTEIWHEWMMHPYELQTDYFASSEHEWMKGITTDLLLLHWSVWTLLDIVHIWRSIISAQIDSFRVV